MAPHENALACMTRIMSGAYFYCLFFLTIQLFGETLTATLGYWAPNIARQRLCTSSLHLFRAATSVWHGLQNPLLQLKRCVQHHRQIEE